MGQNIKSFYFIMINEMYIGLDKSLTPNFKEANIYQGDSISMLGKLIKQGHNKEDIKIINLEIKEEAIENYLASKHREEQFNSILED